MHLISGGLALELEFDAANTASAETGADWTVQDVSLLGTLREIDSALATSYAHHALKGNPLSLHYVPVGVVSHVFARFLDANWLYWKSRNGYEGPSKHYVCARQRQLLADDNDRNVEIPGKTVRGRAPHFPEA